MPRLPGSIVNKTTPWLTLIPFATWPMCIDRSNLTAAKPLYEEALELYRGNLDTKLLDLANAVRPYALLNEEQGDLEKAKELWEEARNLYASLRIEAGVLECDDRVRRHKQV